MDKEGKNNFWDIYQKLNKKLKIAINIAIILIIVLLICICYLIFSLAKPGTTLSLPGIEFVKSECLKNCKSINISITSHKNNDPIKNNSTVNGKMEQNLCDDYFLWIVIYNKNQKQYISATQIIYENEKEWKGEVNFPGAMLNDICELKIGIADKVAHSLLNSFTKGDNVNIDVCKVLKVIIK